MDETEQDYAKTTFNEVAKKYDEIAFFKTSATHVAEMILKHTKLRTLEVLDVACGTGNVVLECASHLRESHFDAIDISEAMLAKAKENADNKNLDNIAFHLQDITKLDVKKKYHVITCSYALFFLPNPQKVLASLVARLRPMGIVIFTIFTADAFRPSSEILLPLLVKYGSIRAKEYDANAWKNLKQRNDIIRLCTLAYVNDMKIESKEIHYGLSVDDWWELMNNTGTKGMLMELTSENYELVKLEYYKAMLKHADMDGEVELRADSYFVVVS